ncbi:hypothetical protein GCM10028803_05880 [Larkinella knui]|uniref:Uncharacterized protein n=1 Tax=Larkinella knui TaxID=2025310 RepID=A0A3P1CK93_9BACT|nr:hypothetical protein [Larkinella knui]RRB13737.1 hypothetical protein EHT87_15870 [Larkinella knui]
MTFEEQLNNHTTLPDFATYSSEPLPDWLEDDDLLRDEAALLGLSDARLDEKTTLIRLYFKRQTAFLEREREQVGEKIGELNLLIEQKANRVDELKQKIARLETTKPAGEPQFLRTGSGLLAFLILLIGTYFLIAETLKPHFQESRFIAIGVLLAGVFGRYDRTTVASEAAVNVTIRRLLAETGLPLAASFFVSMQALETQSALKTAGLFLFMFFLFVAAGKSIPSLLTALQNDFRYWQQGKKLEKERIPKTEAWENEINGVTISLDALRVQKWQLLPQLNRADAEWHRINTRRDVLIQLFENEFNLARSLRDRLSERQKRAIVAS